MMTSLYTGATGMKSLSEGMNVVTNNIANVSTVGFKQQQALFSDLMYETQGMTGNSWEAQEGSTVALGQVGMGVQVETVRTSFEQGAFEIGSSVTDLALSGTGFFQVTTVDGEELYTRAGNFRFDSEGVLTLSGGEALSAYAINEDGSLGELGKVQIDPFAPMAAKATSNMDLGFNFGSIEDSDPAAANPYFSMVENYDGTKAPALDKTQYSYTQDLSIIDANGERQTLTLYVDGTPDASPNDIMEFVIAGNPTEQNPTGEVLMAGTMTFDASGQLVDMSAFTNSGGDPKDLANWTPATYEEGLPQFTLNEQNISLNFGIVGEQNTGAIASAADVGLDKLALPGLTNVERSHSATTAAAGSNSMFLNEQDGYTEGLLTNLNITDDGRVVGSYNNGQDADLYEIPVCRFTSEAGLRREGSNFYSATPESGTMDMGKAGTENYATMHANTLEVSNVDMASEMVNMIVTQRGFQSNSKIVTTADEMLKKAMELKRA